VPEVIEIRSMLPDYEGGRLGSTWELDAALVECLQVCSAEKALWERRQQEALE
jgi:hypothetical protein